MSSSSRCPLCFVGRKPLLVGAVMLVGLVVGNREAMGVIIGDANADGQVDDTDASILEAHWLQTGGWGNGDFNGDGNVNDKDAAILAAHWGSTLEETPMPEPRAADTDAVTFDFVQNADPSEGLKSFTVRAYGTGINVLGRFTITGTVNQTDDEWSHAGSYNADTDSCVVFGDVRIPFAEPTTLETGLGLGPLVGTLNNYAVGPPEKWDGYLAVGTPSTSDEYVDLLQIVLATGASATGNLTVWTTTGPDFVTVTEHSGQFTVVPEPCTPLVSLGLGALILLFLRRR